METKGVITRPMEILDRLREALKPLGYEIVGFEVPINDYITVKIAEPTSG